MTTALDPSTETPRDPAAPAPLLIVGVGASAGGLEALSALLRALPADSGMGFVVVQHMDPLHPSALSALLGRVTSMPVVDALDGMQVQANQVHVVTPGTQITLVAGKLQVGPRERTPGHSIDLFMESLAQDAGPRAIGVILSGAASDGTFGLEAIKAAGGITLAQDDSARYDSMPRSAIASGCADFVLSPEKIAQQLVRIQQHPEWAADDARLAGRAGAEAGSADSPDSPDSADSATSASSATSGNGLRRILLQLRQHSGVDYTLYKPSTISRRVTRRMVLGNHAKLDDYSRFLSGNGRELGLLHADMLISVTSFFRNAEAFEVLQREVFPKLLQEADAEPLRVWVLGCSTGQEAYSIAMAYTEVAHKANSARKLQIFAADLNNTLLDTARKGLYAKSQVQDVSAERLQRFFVQAEGGWRVNKNLRDSVVFARQNVISDPPFARLHLITCRNLLIYFDQALQRRIFPVFHYALRPGGYLMLGASESIGGFTELFAPVDKKQKIFSKRASPTPVLQLPVRSAGFGSKGPLDTTADAVADTANGRENGMAEFSAQREADRLLVNRYAPPGVLIDEQLQVLQFRGATGPYLQSPSGRATFDVLKMAREGLMLPLRGAIERARKTDAAVQVQGVRVVGENAAHRVDFEVLPLKNLRERCWLVLFHSDQGAGLPGLPKPTPTLEIPQGSNDRRVAELERELAETRDYLQSIQEQHEAALEELQAAHEEVQSANEELQSLNEELETSKEELESTNEELVTINEELSARNTELARLNADLVNVQNAAGQAIVLLNRDLSIRRFTAQAEQHLKLQTSDIGRAFSSLRHGLQMRDLETRIREMVDGQRPSEHEVQAEDGHWFALQLRPYLTLEGEVEGAMLVLQDINELKRRSQAVQAARDEAQAVLRTARDPLLMLQADLHVISANAAFYRVFGGTPASVEGLPIYEIGGGQWHNPRLKQLIEDILPLHKAFDDYEVEQTFDGLGRRTMLLNARRLSDGSGQAERILLGIQDVTALWQAQTDVRDSQARYRALVETSAQIVWTADAKGQLSDDSPSFSDFTGRSHAQLLGLGWLDALHPDDRARTRIDWLHAVATQTPFVTSYRLQHASHGWRWMTARAVPVRSQDGRVHEWVGMNVDETERKHAEQRLAQSELRFRTMVDSLPAAIYTTDARGRLTHFNPAAAEFAGRTPEIGSDCWCVNEVLFHADGSPMAMADSPLALTVKDGRDLRGLEIQAERPDGSRRWLRVYPSRMVDADGRVLGGINMLLDVTASRAVEQAMVASEARYRALFSSTPVAVFVCDAEGRVQDHNRRAEELWGEAPRASERFGASPKLRRTDGSTIAPEASPVALALAGGGTLRNLELLISRPQDSDLTVLATFAALLEPAAKLSSTSPPGQPTAQPAGAVTGVIASMLDITELKRAEDALRESDRRKGEFLAMLAHELRNPLAPIRNGIELLRRASLAEPAALKRAVESAVPMMERQLRQMTRLVDDLLDVGRISRGHIELRRERVELASVLHHAVEAARSTFDGLQHQLTLRLPERPVYLNADPARLAQIVGNLLNNAGKFTRPGGHVEIEAVIEEPTDPAQPGAGEPRVSVVVRDNGIGIAVHQQPLLFEMFVRLIEPGAQSAGGLGIGLALVKSLVGLHGGQVGVRSAGAGMGSEFTVSLPMLSEPSAGPVLLAAAPVQAAPAATPAPAPSLSILVVDDNLDAARSLRDILVLEGHAAVMAHDGPSALASIAVLRPDVVLLDLGLPGMSGLDVARRLREIELERGPESKSGVAPSFIVALTGWGQAADRERSAAAGFDDHLVKPVDLPALFELLAKRSAQVH